MALGTFTEETFQISKKLFTPSKLLASLPLTLTCDAPTYGIAAVLACQGPDGCERPIGYVSRTLNKVERNYMKLETEDLSCIIGIKHFYSYLSGHPFELITDHKPMLGFIANTSLLQFKHRQESIADHCFWPYLSTPLNFVIEKLMVMQILSAGFLFR